MSNTFKDFLSQLLKKDNFSEDTITKAKWIIIDTVVAGLYGIKTEEPLQNYINRLRDKSDSQHNTIPIMGTNIQTSIKNSTIIHGTAIVSNELDEGNTFAKGHPAAHLLPTMLASAIENNATGTEFIRAFILGYEASARLAYASRMKDYMHPHGTWGNVGGTVAAGILAKKKNEDIVEAAMLSATLPLATTWQAAEKGITARNLYTGIGTYLAYEALELQSYGFKSSTHVVDDIWSNIMSDGFDDLKLFEELFSPPLVEKNYFKLYPSCRFTHGAIDALNNLIKEGPIEIEDIKEITVETYSLAARCKNPIPKTPLEAKFSIPFMLSTLLHGTSLYKTNENNILFNSSIQSLSTKIKVLESSELTAMLPKNRTTRVTIRFKDNRQKSNTVYTASGEYSLPFEKEKLVEKYNSMLQDHYPSNLLVNLMQSTFELETYTSILEWVDTFSLIKVSENE